MSKPIGLAPLDGSASAEYILPWALLFAQGCGLRLVLVRFMDVSGITEDASPATARQEAQTHLDAVVARLTAQENALDVETRAIEADGHVGRRISELAEELRAELILIGAHGWSGIRRQLLGSVVRDVVRTAKSPSLIVRGVDAGKSTTKPAIHRILVPLDGSERAETVLPQVTTLAESFDAELDLLQAVPWSWMLPASPDALDATAENDRGDRLEQAAGVYLAEVQQRLPSGVRSERHVLHGDPASVILDHAEQTRADLIALNTHGRSGILRWVLGSVAERVLSTSDIPVLLTRFDSEQNASREGDAQEARDAR